MSQKGFSPDILEGLPNLGAVRQFHGTHEGRNKRFGIVAARFNISLVGPSVEAAVDTFTSNGVKASDIDVVWVPGSFELFLPLQRLAASGRYSALLPIGVVLEGATRHADLIMDALMRRFVELSSEFDCPIIDAVVSARTYQQAEERCLTKNESRAAYAALAALEMASHPKDFV